MNLKKELEEAKEELQNMKKGNVYKNNFDLGNTFKKIIYFLLILIIALLGTIIFFVVKNNDLAIELSQYTCETDIMEQDGVYNFIDSEGNMITTDADAINKYLTEYYGKTKENK